MTDQERLEAIMSRYEGAPEDLIPVLQDIQDEFNYLPKDELKIVAGRLNLPLTRVYSVATFYALFNLEPQGTHTVSICRGTACHTRGSRALLERLKLRLGLSGVPEEAGSADKLTFTTPDRRFTIRTVACFGQCALAPVAEVNHDIRGHVKEQALMREVDKLRKEGGR